ncbi:MAG: PD40 domain-containing protein [Bacteroidales bacterium]|nr:PD40 domain-containing protein [Bacteroidales bacterium]
MKTFTFILTYLLFTTINYAQEVDWKYYGQTTPDTIPELFMPDQINHLAHSSPTFSPNGKEIYWSIVGANKQTRKIYCVSFENNKWSEPKIASFSGKHHDDQPFISYDGEKLFFASKRPKTTKGEEINDIWISKKVNDEWSEPKPIDNLVGFWTPTLTKDETVYFLELFDQNRMICFSKLKDGKYSSVECLNENINAEGSINWCPFIAPDESYIIFSSNRMGGYGNGDLYISFRNENGNWGKAINMGSAINTDKQERFPGVSPDGKYLFFTRWNSSPYYHDLYWISSKIIQDLRNQVLKMDY